MAVICDMAKGRLANHRYFLESVHDYIKTDFMTNKVASSYIKIIFIMCYLLLTAKDDQCPVHYQWCLLSVYRNIMTSSQQKLKNFLFFICLVHYHISPCHFCLTDDMRVDRNKLQ